MGLVKNYLRYNQDQIINNVSGPKGNLAFFQNTKYSATTSSENLVIWDLKTSEKFKTFYGQFHEATVLTISPTNVDIAVGYRDGSIRLFNIESEQDSIEFHGHKTAITTLNYDRLGQRLVSGSQDTNLVIWDIISETGKFRLRGHKGNITKCSFLSLNKNDYTLNQIANEEENIIISSSKDGTIKFWDINTQHCFKTLLEHSSEVWDFLLIPSNNSRFIINNEPDFMETEKKYRLISISSDNLLRMWDIFLNNKVEDRENLNDISGDSIYYDNQIIIKYIGNIIRNTKFHGTRLNIDPGYKYLGCHGNEDKLSIYQITSDVALNKRYRKRASKLQNALPERNINDEIELISEILLDGAKVKSCDLFIFTTKNSKHGKTKGLKEKQTSEIDPPPTNKEILKVMIMRSDNMISVYHRNTSDLIKSNLGAGDLWTPKKCIESQGHRTDVRSLCFSSDNSLLLSTSGESVKLWNRSSQQCIRTMPCEYGLCSLLLTSDKFAAVGTKTGKIHLYDCGSGELLENIDAHDGTVWCLCQHPNNTCIISGGADKYIKFWDMDLVDDPNYSQTSKRLTLVNVRSLQLSDDVLCMKASVDHKFLAVGLLDNTVKLFFLDTLKFFLCLYGHSMPVTSMDISHDSTLIATGSADRSVKIWGTRFGDCHKSLLGHSDTVTALVFVPPEPDTIFHNYQNSKDGDEATGKLEHLFFTAGKDGLIIQWDADKFERIMTLKGHHAEIWALAMSPSGAYLASASHDRTIRVWGRTDEILSLQDEKDKEIEEEGEKFALQALPTNVPLNQNSECGLSSVKSVETLDSVERIIEAIDVYVKERAALMQISDATPSDKSTRSDDRPQRSADALDDETDIFQGSSVINNCGSSDEGFIEETTPQPKTVREILAEREVGINSVLGTGVTPCGYVLSVLKNIKFSELEYATLLLPRTHLNHLFAILHECIAFQPTHDPKTPQYTCQGWELEICTKLLCYLLRTQIAFSGCGGSAALLGSGIPEEIRPVILDLKDKVVQRVSQYRDCIGFNRATLGYLATLNVTSKATVTYPERIDTNKAIGYIGGLTYKKKNKKGKKRKKLVEEKKEQNAKPSQYVAANKNKVFVTPL